MSSGKDRVTGKICLLTTALRSSLRLRASAVRLSVIAVRRFCSVFVLISSCFVSASCCWTLFSLVKNCVIRLFRRVICCCWCLRFLFKSMCARRKIFISLQIALSSPAHKSPANIQWHHLHHLHGCRDTQTHWKAETKRTKKDKKLNEKQEMIQEKIEVMRENVKKELTRGVFSSVEKCFRLNRWRV